MVLIRIGPSQRQSVVSLLHSINSGTSSCPCHSHTQSHTHSHTHSKNYASAVNQTREYAFEMAASAIRYGEGATLEVGMDVANLKCKRVALVTDKNVSLYPPVLNTIQSLDSHGIQYKVYDNVRVEPKDYSIMDAIEWGRKYNPDAIIAVGGGSVMDTAKVMNLYTIYKDKDLLEFVNAPIGKGSPITRSLLPLIAIPTTAGTGSETTGTAIFDIVDRKAKTGIANRALKPMLGIVDPINTRSLPSAVHASAGLDVLCHALESYTAIPYYERTPRPSNPILRPAYQGSNPISDVWCMTALKMCVKYLPRVVKNPADREAQSQMILAATFAGIGFGNAGVHLCHGMSYPISGQNVNYKHSGYEVDHPIVPHGVSVAVTAPAVFAFTGPSSPDRHLEAARVFGVDTSNVKQESAGEVLSNALKEFLIGLGDQPRGLEALGFSRSNIDTLVQGTLPQRRVLDLAPGDVDHRALENLFEAAMVY